MVGEGDCLSHGDRAESLGVVECAVSAARFAGPRPDRRVRRVAAVASHTGGLRPDVRARLRFLHRAAGGAPASGGYGYLLSCVEIRGRVLQPDCRSALIRPGQGRRRAAGAARW